MSICLWCKAEFKGDHACQEAVEYIQTQSDDVWTPDVVGYTIAHLEQFAERVRNHHGMGTARR